MGCNVLVQGMVLLQVLESQVFEIDGNDVLLPHPLFQQMLAEQLKEYRFAASTEAGHHFYDVLIPMSLQKFQILISCYSFHDICSQQNQFLFKTIISYIRILFQIQDIVETY